MSKPRILLRADASREIGYGHLVRSLAAASILGRDFDCAVCSIDPDDFHRAQAAGVCPLIPISSDREFLDAIVPGDIPVLDNYFFTTEYQRRVRERAGRLVCFDVVPGRHYVADAIVTIYPDLSSLPFSAEPYTRLYAGTEYAMLRPPFFKKPPEKTEKLYDATLILGGTDQLRLTDKILNLLHSANPTLKLAVIAGRSVMLTQENTARVASLMRGVGAETVADAFRASRAVICSASGSALEALACGTPVLAGYYVANQEPLYHSLVAEKLITPLGDLRSLSSLNLQEANLPLPTYAPNPQLLTGLFSALDYDFRPYYLLSRDLQLALLEMRNRPEVRVWMDNTEPISPESHLNFIDRLKTDKSKEYFAIFYRGEMIGSVNAAYEPDGSAERGIIIDPAHSGRGHARRSLTAFYAMLRQRGITRITTHVKRGNIASNRLETALGASLIESSDTYNRYVLPIYNRRNVGKP